MLTKVIMFCLRQVQNLIDEIAVRALCRNFVLFLMHSYLKIQTQMEDRKELICIVKPLHIFIAGLVFGSIDSAEKPTIARQRAA